MKKNLNLILLVMSSMFVAHSAHALKFVIYTDEPTGKASEKVAEVMKNTYPFSKFNVEVEIVKVSSSELDCFNHNGIERALTCKNLEGFQERALKNGGDQAMVIKDLNKHGGSASVGESVPVMASGSNPRVMLHEYMHTLGLCDEYEYKASEADWYCSMDTGGANLVFITPEDPYIGDRFARNKHRFDIPWFKDILSTTPITNSNGKILGTGNVDFSQNVAVNPTKMPSTLSETSGLYKGKSCNNAKFPKAVWHPGGGSTVMEKVENGLGAPLEKIVERILASKGASRKMQIDEVNGAAPERFRGTGEHPAQVMSPAPEMAPAQADDSGRGFFKSFFDILQGAFESMTRSWTK